MTCPAAGSAREGEGPVSDDSTESTAYAERMFPAPLERGVGVLGPMHAASSVNLRDTINASGVACIGWTGGAPCTGEYCFAGANGDIPAESTMCAGWCFQEGYSRVGFFWEKGSSGTDYSDY